MILFTKPTQTKIFEYQTSKFTVYPKNSREGLEAEHKMQIKIFQLIMNDENCETKDDNRTLKHELQEKIAIETICDLIIDWSGVTDEDNKPLECNDKYKNLLLNQNKVLAENIMLFCSKVDAFPRNKKKS